MAQLDGVPARGQHLGMCSLTRAIDELDRSIIAILQKNGRTPYVDMARTLSVAEATIRRRVENLIADNVIHIAAWTDPYKVGIEVVVLISLDVDLPYLEDVARNLAKMSCVRLVAYQTGDHDILVEALFASEENLLHFLRDELARIPGIRHSDTSIVLGMLKRTYEWEIPEVDQRRDFAREEVMPED
jgi:Lrp/AsnC family transcriptional regulator for asnA, asnC and gidA